MLVQESAACGLINTEHLVYSQVPSKRVYSITNMYPTEQEDIAHREGILVLNSSQRTIILHV